MRSIYILFSLGLASLSCAALPSEITARDYHRRIGIPTAEAIKRNEEQGIDSKVVGGSFTDISRVPYQVGLIMQILTYYHSVCGGSLVSNTCVISAAHCYDDGVYVAESFTVALGSNMLYTGGVRLASTNFVVHPRWDTETILNDIMVIRIPYVAYSNVIQPIALPSGSQMSDSFVGRSAVVSGYGQLGDNIEINGSQQLSSLSVPIMSYAECRVAFGIYARDSNLCTSGVGRKGVCHGDSGGPIAVTANGKPLLVGVSSFGHWDGCQAGKPSAYTRITSYVPWLQTII